MASDTSIVVLQNGAIKLLDISILPWATPSTAVIIPGAVNSLAALPIDSSDVTLTWTVPSTGTSPFNYTAQYRITGNSTWITATNAINNLSITVSGLTAQTSYDFQVIASNSAGSTPSNLISATTPAQPPSGATNITAG